MSTILPIGTTVCIDCRQPVAIVRRTVEQPCHAECSWVADNEKCPEHGHTHAIPDVAWTVVNADGERHICAAR